MKKLIMSKTKYSDFEIIKKVGKNLNGMVYKVRRKSD